ncbi:MAG: Rieske (2Fe-2S) protein [Vicinamibacterales bacterium]
MMNSESAPTPTPTTRRRFLSRAITTIHTAIVGVIGIIAGGAVTSPVLERAKENWLPAGRVSDLPENDPLAVTLRIVREDGYTVTVDRRTVFLVRTGASVVTALDSTCTHLGCRVSWDTSAQVLRCPCHGGTYDRTGKVMSGPPPAPLTTLVARIEGDQVLVQI